jgi:hypothetical protein
MTTVFVEQPLATPGMLDIQSNHTEWAFRKEGRPYLPCKARQIRWIIFFCHMPPVF